MKSFRDFQNKSQRLYEGILSSNGVGIEKSLLDVINYDAQHILDIDIQGKKMCQDALH